MSTIGRDSFRDKVRGCWLGKTIGGTLGAPYEGRTERLHLTFYDPVPTGAIANDDLDLQLVWLAALREIGPGLDERTLGEYWLRSLQYPFDEYGMALWNLGRGLPPPVSGQHGNPFGDCMGAPIRSEIWACVAPGCPSLAAAYAYCDAVVDHGDEGVWGEMLFAALQSAAFVTGDRDRLLEAGLAVIPESSRVAGAVRLVREQHEEDADWLAARQAVLERFGDVNFTDAPQNIAFTILGWLYGRRAADSLCTAVNCGYDTDCTGATLGAILGILRGPAAFEQAWIDPVGEEVVVGWGVHHCVVPRTLDELTDWTVDAADRVLAYHDAPLRLGEASDLKGYRLPDVGADLLAERLDHHAWTVRAQAGEARVYVSLGGPPALRPHESRTVAIDVIGDLPSGLRVTAPDGWGARVTSANGSSRAVQLTAPGDIGFSLRHELVLQFGGEEPVAVPICVVPAYGWRVAGPLEARDLVAALNEAPMMGQGGEHWTPDHRLELDDDGPMDRLYLVRTTMLLPEAARVRLVCATPELQRVWVDGELLIRKDEPTPFVPAPHRSGPNTVAEDLDWAEGTHEIEILLGARAGQPAVVHLYATRPRDADGPRMVPLPEQLVQMPRPLRVTL